MHTVLLPGTLSAFRRDTVVHKKWAIAIKRDNVQHITIMKPTKLCAQDIKGLWRINIDCIAHDNYECGLVNLAIKICHHCGHWGRKHLGATWHHQRRSQGRLPGLSDRPPMMTKTKKNAIGRTWAPFGAFLPTTASTSDFTWDFLLLRRLFLFLPPWLRVMKARGSFQCQLFSIAIISACLTSRQHRKL